MNLALFHLSFFLYPWKRQQEEGLKQQQSDHSGCANQLEPELVVQLKVVSHMISQIFTGCLYFSLGTE